MRTLLSVLLLSGCSGSEDSKSLVAGSSWPGADTSSPSSADTGSNTPVTQYRYDSTPAWPLCGRITDNPPLGWEESVGCPADRWNSIDHTDYPINSTFGPRQLFSADYRYDYHRGIDLSADVGTPIFAVAPGEVVKAGEDPSYSDPVVQLRHYRPGSDGSCAEEGCWHSNYLHLSGWSVDAGERVVRGQLIGHTGASASGYPHLHFEVRDSRPEDPKSAWQRDTVHPLKVLPYPDGTSEPEVTIEAVDATNWSAPTVDVLVAFRSPMPELDMIRLEVRVLEISSEGDATEIQQPWDTPWFVDPPFFDVDEWNRQYTHKDSTTFPWSSFSDCPHAGEHTESYDAHVHMDRADPADPRVGLFNGVRVAPAFYNQTTTEWHLQLTFLGLTTPEDAMSLRFIAEFTDARDNSFSSAPVDVSSPISLD